MGGRPALAYDRFVRTAVYLGAKAQGHHNRNYVVRPFTGPMRDLVGRGCDERVTVRLRLRDALPVAIRTWPDEGEILAAVGSVLPNVPECLVSRGDTAIHSYVEGVPLSSVCPNGKPVDTVLIEALAGLLAEMGHVGKDALPPLPPDWPGHGSRDGRAFLSTLAHMTEQQIRRPNWAAFGGLFAALGIPEDAMVRYAERVPRLTRRPYALLHTDLHRGNVIVPHREKSPLICVDWELATFGDPLHDLATHLVRMRYPAFQWTEVTDAWAAAMTRLRPEAVEGLERDLPHYVAFERAQSVYPDVMRAARSLSDSFDQKALDEATAAVLGALEAAAEPLRLTRMPGQEEVESVLFRWRAARGGRRRGSRPGSSTSWRPDPRVPECPDFPHSAVLDALVAEGAAPAHRVFKGTAHLNTVVRVESAGFPVVVRRKVNSVPPLERRFLSEHAVLVAIEKSGARVRAPRLLALGVSNLKDPFAIHSYEGPGDSRLPPRHPVNGLLPHEADDLVDQLCALTQVDHQELDPAAGGIDFFRWLSGELARLVDGLPEPSQQCARELGLPDGQRLREILDRYRVVPRTPSLLHGDLNPWNLVRRDGAVVVIDWELAMVGDPLYDLMRHMHLTPTRPEIRRRMLDRWSGRLPAHCTDGWRDDWRLYRWIEIVRSAYVDLDRLVTGVGLDAPNVQRAVDAYATTLEAATASLGLPSRKMPANPGVPGRTGAAGSLPGL